MKDKIKLSYLLLNAVQELKVAKLQHIQGKLSDFCSKCAEITKSSNIYHVAVDKHWFISAEKIETKFSRNINELTHHLYQFKDIVDHNEGKPQNLSGIYADISQIEQEFGELKYNLKEKTISVITDPIELEGIPLGSFEIRLFINLISRLYSDLPYSIIALEPNAAATDENITHPHVSNETLCEGDGYNAIRRAIEQGRFYDFFTLVINILNTYNPSSPYVSLGDWSGVYCYECNDVVSGDDRYSCEDCQNDFCCDCSTYCKVCETTICLTCSIECTSCKDPVCKFCAIMCSDCEKIFCPDCLNDDNLCNQCQEKREEQEYDEEPETSSAIQPDSLGQTAVHA